MNIKRCLAVLIGSVATFGASFAAGSGSDSTMRSLLSETVADCRARFGSGRSFIVCVDFALDDERFDRRSELYRNVRSAVAETRSQLIGGVVTPEEATTRIANMASSGTERSSSAHRGSAASPAAVHATGTASSRANASGAEDSDRLAALEARVALAEARVRAAEERAERATAGDDHSGISTRPGPCPSRPA